MSTTAHASLREANIARQAEWDTGNQITLSYRGNELAGETGEACNIIKKLERERLGIRGSKATREQLAEELADVIICADLIAMGEGIDLLNDAVPTKFNATSEKVGLQTRLLPVAPAPASSPQPVELETSAADLLRRLQPTFAHDSDIDDIIRAMRNASKAAAAAAADRLSLYVADSNTLRHEAMACIDRLLSREASAVKAAREQAVEECARVADEHREIFRRFPGRLNSACTDAIERVASAIRALRTEKSNG